MVSEVRSVRIKLWLVSRIVSSHERVLVVTQYSTWLVLGSSVVQLMTALSEVISETDTAEITGGVVSAAAKVVKVCSSDIAKLPAASLDLTL